MAKTFWHWPDPPSLANVMLVKNRGLSPVLPAFGPPNGTAQIMAEQADYSNYGEDLT
jgi:hypothetical protein